MFRLLISFIVLFSSFLFAGEKMNQVVKIEKDFSSSINKFIIQVPLDLVLETSKVNKYTLEAENSVLSKIDFIIKDTTLIVKSKKGFKTEEKVSLKIRTKELLSLELNGSIDSLIKNIQEDNLHITLDGSIDLNAKNSKVTNLNLNSKGANDIDLTKLKASYANLHLKGTGDVSVNVTKTLDINSKGSIDIYYKGNPKIIKKIDSNTDIEKID